MFTDNLDDLAIAIVKQAAHDYGKSLRKLKMLSAKALRGHKLSYTQKTQITEAVRKIEEDEWFFREGIQRYFDYDAWGIRNELLKQSGLSEELLDQFKNTRRNESCK